ncbi:MAG TPA: AAA family ATPase, partial [Accumulibacter sp.]
RVIARLKEFMSDPENRGRVVFILMTNRPDKLDSDIKRPGRLDRKIPFFYAETAAERAAVIAAIFRRYAIPCTLSAEAIEEACAALEGYSNADLEAVALLAAEFAERAGVPLDAERLGQAIGDFMPPQETAMLRYMEMLAVSETSRRSLLPQRFRTLSAQDVQTRLAEFRRQINS